MLFEGDLQIVIKGLSDGSANQSIYGYIIDDILHKAAQLIEAEPRLGIRGAIVLLNVCGSFSL